MDKPKTPGQVAISDSDLLSLMQVIDPLTVRVPSGVRKIADAIIDHARTQIEAEAQSFKEAVIDALVVSHIYAAEHDTDARKAVADLQDYAASIALAPQVSRGAAELVAEARAAAIEDACAALIKMGLPKDCVFVNNVRELATLPPSHICVPVEFLEKIIAHVRPQIEAEARATAIEDVKKLILGGSFLHDQAPGKLFVDDVCKAIDRELAALPPSHVVVPVEHIRWVAKQDIPNDHACIECVPHTTCGAVGFKCAVHYARAMIAGRKV